MQIREKVELYGVEKLLPFESISLITSIDIEKLQKYKSFKEIFNDIDCIDATPLQKNKLRALKQIAICTQKEDMKKYKVKNPWDISKYFMEEMRYLDKEVFKIVLLNCKNEIIEDIDISVGILDTSTVHPREVFREAIKRPCKSIILLHNHPSGSLEPSKEDKNVTDRLIKTGRIVGIEVIDHIILAGGGYFSFKENNMIF